MSRRGLVLAAALVLPWGSGDALGAGAKRSTLELSVILATHADGGVSIDPQLRDLPQLTRDQPFVRYNDYKLLARKRFPLEMGKPIEDSLVNGRTLRLVLDGVSEDAGARRYQMEAQIAEPGKAAFLRSLQVTAGENQPFFVGGQSYRSGTLFLEVVILP